MKPIHIFSLIKNFKYKYEQNKNIENIERVVFVKQYEKQPDLIRIKCNELYNLVNCSHFTIDDIKLYMYYECIYGRKIRFDFNSKNIYYNREFFTEKRMEKDKSFIIELSHRNDIHDLQYYFDINDHGSSYIYELIINRYVSPYFYIRMSKYIKLNGDNESKEHKRFRYILDELRDVLRSKKLNKKLTKTVMNRNES